MTLQNSTSSEKLPDELIVLKGWRSLLPLRITRTQGIRQVRLDWPRAFKFVSVFFLLGWISLTSAGFLWIKYGRGVRAAAYLDVLLLPIRWKQLQQVRGEFYIDQGLLALERKDYGAAYHLFKSGLVRAPTHLEGRKLLAQFFLAAGRSNLAQQTLVDGLAWHANNPDYLNIVFSFLFQFQQDQEALTLTQQLLKSTALPKSIIALLVETEAYAYFLRGNYDQAEALLQRHQRNESFHGRLLLARIDWERGYRELALFSLRNQFAANPNNPIIYQQLITYLREAGEFDEARRLSLLQELAAPNDPNPRIYQLYAYDQCHEPAEVEKQVEAIFADFPADSTVLLSLGDFAANTGRPDLARRIYEHCKSHNLPWEGPALMIVEAHLVAGQYQDGLEATRALLKENPEWAKRHYAIFNGLQAIAHYALGDNEAAQLFITNFLGQANMNANNLIAVARRLTTLNALPQAHQVLERAIAVDPLNQAALTSLIELDLRLGNTDLLPRNVAKLLAMRKPSQKVLHEAYTALGSDLLLFSPERNAVLESLESVLSAGSLTPQET